MIPGKAIKKDKLLGIGGYAKVYLATIDTSYKVSGLGFFLFWEDVVVVVVFVFVLSLPPF
jgi:hypothetical protein